MNQKLATLLRVAELPASTNQPAMPRADWRDRAAGLLPLALLAGFAVLLALVLGDRFLPGRAVTITSVVTVSDRGETGAVAKPAAFEDAPMLFQASGWVEPDPWPVKATALVDGVVATVEVLEGQTVRKGQLLATLIDEDARLDLSAAQSRLTSLKAQAAGHVRQIEVARAGIATLEKQVLAAKAKRDEYADRSRRSELLPRGSIPEKEVVQARLQLATQEAEIEALSASGAELRGKVENLIAVSGDFDARIAEAATEVARRELALERTRVLSPVDGIVLRLLAVPGQKRMLGMDDPDSATVAVLYEPGKLQARIDVPLDDAARLSAGQPVRIRSSFLPDRVFRGSVSRIVGEADLQRNTLQAKVQIEDPDLRLRPEMLCRAEFLAPFASGESGGGGDDVAVSTGGAHVRIFVPVAALTGASGDAARVWRLDGSGERVQSQEVSLGTERREDHRLVLEGLRPGDRVVVHPPDHLKPGERVRSQTEPEVP